MLIFLYGPDAYRRALKAREIIQAFQKKYSSLAVERFHMDEDDSMARLKAFTANQSLFDKAKLAAIKSPEEAPKEFPAFLKTFAEDRALTMLISADKKLAKEFEFLTGKPSLSEEFPKPEPSALASFIKKEAARQGAKISVELLEALATTFQSDTWGIATEIQKIALGGAFDGRGTEPAFFPLLQTLKGGRSLGQKLSALTALIEEEEPAAIFNILASLADPALKIKMADCDALVKSGKIEYEEALLDLVISN